MNANLAERLAELPHLLSAHVILSMTALVCGIAVSVPLGIVAAHRLARIRAGEVPKGLHQGRWGPRFWIVGYARPPAAPGLKIIPAVQFLAP